MRAFLLVAALLLSGCTGIDWAASDAACEKRLEQPGQDGLPAQIDARNLLGGALRGSGPIEFHCDALFVLKGGDYVLDGVDGRIGSLDVREGGKLEIQSSRLLTVLHAHAASSLTIKDSVVHVSGFMVILDLQANVRLERATFVPDPFFQGYMFGDFGGTCDFAQFGPLVPWHLEDVQAGGVWEAALSAGTVRNATFSKDDRRESHVCFALAPGATLEGLTLHTDGFEVLNPGAAPATLRGVSGRIGQAMLHGEGKPAVWLLDDWPSRTGVTLLQVEGWAAMEGQLVPVGPAEPDAVGTVVFTDEADASQGCSAGAGAVVGQGRWVHAAYASAAPTVVDAPALWLAYVAGDRQEAGPVTIPDSAMDRDVPALGLVCVGGSLQPVAAFEAMVRLGGTLGCARHEGTVEDVEFRTMVDGPDPQAACAARMMLPA